MISLNENKNVPEDEKFKQNANIPAAILLEGKFTSLYKNRASKTQIDSLAALAGQFRSEISKDNKIIIVADGDIVLNDFTRAKTDGQLPYRWGTSTLMLNIKNNRSSAVCIPVANREFLLNCLEYLVNNPAIIETRNKDIVLRLAGCKKGTG